MNSFWNGFAKQANYDPNAGTFGTYEPQPAPSPMPAPAPSGGRNLLMPALGAAAAGFGAYKFFRGGAKDRLVKTVMGERPQSSLGRLGHRLLHGADEVVYTPTTVGAKYPKVPKKVKGTVLYEHPEDVRRVVGDKGVGGVSKNTQRQLEDKFQESELLNRAAPDLHMNTRSGLPLHKLNKKMKGDYLVKSRQGYGSGVGGEAFLSKADIDKHLAGEKLTRKKETLLRHYKKDPSAFMSQEKIDIGKGHFSGAPRELRVHVIDGKAVPGASMPRGANVEDYLSTGKAENAMTRALKGMKDADKKGLTMAADVAMTPNGPKILELNRGAHQSGLLDPSYLWNKYKGNPLTGAGAVAGSAKANQAIYHHMTGRSSELSAGAKGLGVGLGTGALLRAQQPQQQYQYQ